MIFQVLGGGVGSMRRVVVKDQVGVAASIYERHYEELKERQQLKNARPAGSIAAGGWHGWHGSRLSYIRAAVGLRLDDS